MTRAMSLASLWRQSCKKFANQASLETPDGVWTYADLDQKSELIGAQLSESGVSQGDVIGILSHKSVDSYTLIIACLKFGYIYVNLDPESPASRLEKMLDVCLPRLIFVDCDIAPECRSMLEKRTCSLLDAQSLNREPAGLRFKGISPRLHGLSPAYIMFTSGSTGFPKGVTITHGGLINFISWAGSYFKINNHDKFAQLSPMFFDNSVFDFYVALFSGACLVPITKELLRKPYDLVQYISRKKCTIWFSVPSLLVYLLTVRALQPGCLSDIRLFIFGGEGFPKGELRKLYDLFCSQAKLINVYGPTEGTCICSSYEISQSDFERMDTLAPLGTINPAFDYVILDPESNVRVSRGDKGELCITGPNLSLGYFNQPELTDLKFVQNPEISCFESKVYRTGDLVFECDQVLQFAGRLDNQIKHMGYRVELEEIEACLHVLDIVDHAVVMYIKRDDLFGKFVALVQTASGCVERGYEVAERCNSLLPTYMRVAEVKIVERLPRNANGKVDRSAASKYFETVEV